MIDKMCECLKCLTTSVVLVFGRQLDKHGGYILYDVTGCILVLQFKVTMRTFEKWKCFHYISHEPPYAK